MHIATSSNAFSYYSIDALATSSDALATSSNALSY